MPETASAKNKIGLWTTTSLVAGNMIAAGIFLMPATLATYGSISLLGWLFSAIGAILLALVFGNLSKLLPNEDGGPYAYTRNGFGDFAGFIIAWGYWISIWCSNAAIAISFVSAFSTFFPVLATNPVMAILTGLSTIWLLTWVNTRGIQASGKVQLITTILKLTPLVFVAIGGLFFVHTHNFIPFNNTGHSNFYAITSAGTITLYAFLGIECATIPAGNVANPEKTIPRATMLGTVISTVVYILVTLTVMGMIPPGTLKNSVTPLADAGFIIGGTWVRYLVSAGVAIAAFGALNGWILIQGQIPYAVAKDKLFPPIFKKENRKGTPALGIVIGSILVSLLMMMNYTKGLCAVAYVIISRRKTNTGKKERVKIIAIASVSVAFSLWAIVGAGTDAIYWGVLLLIAGVPLYAVMKMKKEVKS